MIVVDIETSGDLFPERNGIWQIGAVDTDNPENVFLEECRIDDEDAVEEISLKICGKTEEDYRDPTKQSQKEMLEKFFRWSERVKIRNLVCQSTPFDYGFLWARAKKYGIEFSLPKKTVDLYAIAVLRYYQVNGRLNLEGNQIKMGLPAIAEFCGLKSNRLQMKDGKVIKEGKPHNALEDAKLEAECFSRLMYGKNLLKEFEKFQIPNELKRGGKNGSKD
jgi:DNA polymerase III epsilon subunit-like protein